MITFINYKKERHNVTVMSLFYYEYGILHNERYISVSKAQKIGLPKKLSQSR